MNIENRNSQAYPSIREEKRMQRLEAAWGTLGCLLRLLPPAAVIGTIGYLAKNPELLESFVNRVLR